VPGGAQRVCRGPCGLPESIAGTFKRADSLPWGLDGWCDACWLAQRQNAWNAWNQAVREGRFRAPAACEDSRCGRRDRKLAAHHVNYLEAYRVVWLCSASCHARAHREEAPVS
jgi:hypothetical protein